jgi:hypothetical protein
MIVRPLRAWVHYHVLSQLDLGRDAANLYRPQPLAEWAIALLDAYRSAPDRLVLQHAPMTGQTSANAPLEAALDEAVQAVWSTVESAWQADDAHARHARFHEEVAPALMACRRVANGGEPPALLIWDVPALGRHGRAAQTATHRIVATSLAEPSEHVFCQILHEEMHPVTDPLVREMLGDLAGRDTQVGSAGFMVHRALEIAAVEGGRQIIESTAPQFRDAYAAWCAAHGMA